MNESKYIPGPWRIWERSSKYDPSYKIAEAAGCRMIAQTIGGNDEINARLIVAAPDLLAACKAALEFIGRSNKTDWDNEITPILEIAIAKAEKG